jgi:hypothetical protein
VRVELPDSLEQLATGCSREPLGSEHQGHVFSAIREPREDLERLVWRACAANAVSAPVAFAELPLDVAQGRRIGVNG